MPQAPRGVAPRVTCSRTAPPGSWPARRQSRASRTAVTSRPPETARSVAGCCRLVTSLPEVRIDTLADRLRRREPDQCPAYSDVRPSCNPPTSGGRYPDDISIVFADTVVDTSIAQNLQTPAKPARFRVFAHRRHRRRSARFRVPGHQQRRHAECLHRSDRYPLSDPQRDRWRPDHVGTSSTTPALPPPSSRHGRATYATLNLERPLGEGDMFAFAAHSPRVNGEAAKEGFKTALCGPQSLHRGSELRAGALQRHRARERHRVRGLPSTCTIRIFTVRGTWCATLSTRDHSMAATSRAEPARRDNLECAPGLYIFHVEAPASGTHIGKFAIVK